MEKRKTLDEILGRTWWMRFTEHLTDQWRYYACKWFGHKKPYIEKMDGSRCARCMRLVKARAGVVRLSATKLR